MKFIGPLHVHEESIKRNPKPTLITDAVLLGVVMTMFVLIHVLVLVNYGFSALLILVWVLLGGIAAWLIDSIVKCARNIKKAKEKKDK